MSNREIMIVLNPPFSLNKRWDDADQRKSSGLFQELTNYIPDRGILIAREGVTKLTYTAQTT